MTEDFPDFHHKMSKKVAQLTKVIFHLNTKNDEYEYNIKSIVNSYEQEMEQLIKEANIAITKYKEAYDRIQQSDKTEKEL